MNGIVIILVLGAALSHALWNLLLKQTENRLMMMMSMHTVTGLMGLILIPFIGPVEEAALPMLLMSTVVHGGYYVFLTFSYRNVELGQAYPILRGTGPIVVFLASLLFLNEPVSTLQLFAFFFIAGGILSLGLRSFGYFQQQPSTLFLCARHWSSDRNLQFDRRNWGKKFWKRPRLYLLAILPGNVDGASLRFLFLQRRNNHPLDQAWMERCLGWSAGSLCLRICALGHGIGSHHAGCSTSRNKCGDGLSAWHPDPQGKQRPPKSPGCRAGHTGDCAPQSLEPKINLASCRKIFWSKLKNLWRC